MGRLSRGEAASPFREAGELCAVEAIDREGLVVTREGALVRFLRAAPKNPLVMSSAEREQVGHAFGQLAGRLQAGQSIQFYVEAAPVRLDALLTHSADEAERAIRALASRHDERAAALRRLHAALRESLERHADEQAAVDVAYYVVVPYLPDQSQRLDWRALLPGGRRRLGKRAAGTLAGVASARRARVAAPHGFDPRRSRGARSLHASAVRTGGPRPAVAPLQPDDRGPHAGPAPRRPRGSARSRRRARRGR